MVELAKVALRPGAGNLVNALLRAVIDAKESESLPAPLVEGDERSRARALATLHSHPVVRLCGEKNWSAGFLLASFHVHALGLGSSVGVFGWGRLGWECSGWFVGG